MRDPHISTAASGAAETMQPASNTDTPAPSRLNEQIPSMLVDEMDLGVVSAMHAFQRWIVTAMRDSGFRDLTVIDALVLDLLKQRAHNKRLADICFILNVEDTHVVGYSLRKLINRGVVAATKNGKEVTYAITPLGEQHLLRFREIHERHLLDTLSTLQLNKNVLTALAQYLRKMSGLYDQAARAASSF